MNTGGTDLSTFTAIVTAHEDSPHRILGNLLYQTRKPDEILVLASDVKDLLELREDFSLAEFIETENRNDWGHEKRAQGVALASCDFLGFFNHDDTYESTYIEKMMAAVEEGFDAAFCDWNGGVGCVFGRGSSTSGNFIVRSGLARQAGYTSRRYEADGDFINRIGQLGAVTKVPELLYHHNVAR